MKRNPRVTFLTNIPAPYRESMHEILAQSPHIDYSVIYCSKTEPNRQWEFKKGNYKRWYLKERANSLVHNNPNILKYLHRLKPDVVIATGFYPTTLYGFIWCLFKRKKFIPLTDGTLQSEKHLSFIHKLVRKIVYRYSRSYIGASTGSFELYKNYDVPAQKIFRCHLCIDNNRFFGNGNMDKEFDLMFSGQFIERKMPLFFVEVARRVKERMGSCKVLLLGDGPMRELVLEKLKEHEIDYEYAGFVQPHNLPDYFKRARLFLFPTLLDPWGIVANEACAAGLPVITCLNAGVANDLVINDHNGYVLPLDEKIWTDKVCSILSDQSLYERLSSNAVHSVRGYNPEAASKGILDAIEYTVAN